MLKSLKLVSETNAIFHFNATYKILKYCYPLIFFGFTDVTRRFFPVAYMFISHEKTEDFTHFFEELDKVCTKFNNEINPKYMVIDACRAIAKAIQKLLQKRLKNQRRKMQLNAESI